MNFIEASLSILVIIYVAYQVGYYIGHYKSKEHLADARKNLLDAREIFRELRKMETIYILLADSDGTMFSRPEPIGVAVKDPVEAEKYIKANNQGYTQEFKEIRVFDTWQKANAYLQKQSAELIAKTKEFYENQSEQAT